MVNHGVAWLVKILDRVIGVIFKFRGAKGGEFYTVSYGH